MVIDGKRYFESRSILRLAGAKMGFYNSKDSKTSFAADQIVEVWAELCNRY